MGEAITTWAGAKFTLLKKVLISKAAKTFAFFSTTFAWFFSTYVDLWFAIKLFCLATTLDTITAIHKSAKDKGLKFKPWKLFFWKQIQSEYLRVWMRKIFFEYSIYIIIAFAIDTWVFKNTLHFNLLTLKLNIPICAIFLFSFIEFWSVGENLEQAGHKNYLKITFNWFSDFIPEKYKNLFKKVSKSNNKKKDENR